jgi:ATP-dependent Clp protease adaptor protein ClpS
MSGSKKEESVSTKERIETKEPPLYKVILHNDDYTSMEFVVAILKNVFNKSSSEATRIMLSVHHEGVGVAGIYTKEIGETKISIVRELAQNNNFPLKCSLEIA